jgi:hypothetical protein
MLMGREFGRSKHLACHKPAFAAPALGEEEIEASARMNAAHDVALPERAALRHSDGL